MRNKKTLIPTPSGTAVMSNATSKPPAKRGRPKKTEQSPKAPTLVSPIINTNNATILRKPTDETATIATAKKRKSATDSVDTDKKRKVDLNGTADDSTGIVKKTFKRRNEKTTTTTSTQSSSSTTSTPNSTRNTKIFKRRKPAEPLPLLHRPYKLDRILKGHAADDDDSTQMNLWACEFEPNTTTGTVALCGSNNILFLDTHLGRYTKKYTHIEPNEEFLCLAWTALVGPKDLLDEDAAEDAQCNILAAAGQLGSIKLFNTLQNECFRYLFGHTKQVRKLQFSKSKPRWLFSCSDDMTVRLWDIGPPNVKHQENSSMCLAKFSLPTQASEPSALCIAPDLTKIMVGCVQGDLVRFEMKPTDIQKLEREPSDSDQPKNFRHKALFPAGDEWHEGYIDDIFILGQQRQSNTSVKPHGLDGWIVSRGSDDYETLIWNPKTSTKTDADISISLGWPDSNDHAGLRFKVVEKQGDKVLLAGDYEGQIRIFNIGDGRKSRTLEDGTKEMFKPTKVLSHAMSSDVVRDLCISDDTKKIIAVDSANNVFIWNCSG
ncbi:WD40-repeat-containing domain protein [Zychaea mexicana]|uniref:WD40-repeat-containing domain protein n=1 Tax=Zychaea mexicana TaxID=64656 RepID=UPI0022FEAD22|nr:WD40-repeat-containing domain protein [Zychaea mexicana]KAI9490785.1 WD40-repeat-containing domain protein [Zychaea mexicana]